MSDEELRLYAISIAMAMEGPKAVTAEVLEAARDIYDFLKGNDAASIKH